MSQKLVLIDGHSILNRAFYGVPDLSNAEGKAEVIFDNSEGYDRDTDIVISTRCVRNKDAAGMELSGNRRCSAHSSIISKR